MEPKDASLAPAVINDGGPIHQVGTGTESTQFQDDPLGDAQDAADQAAADNQADEAAHDDAVDDATKVDDLVDGHVGAPPE